MPFQIYQGNTVIQNESNLNDNNLNLNHNYAQLMFGIARGIHYMNRMNYFHRNLRLNTVVIDNLCQPHIADFGMSKVQIEHNEVSSEKLVGTIMYEAPDINNFCFNHQGNKKKSNLFKRYKFMQPLKRMRNRKNNGYIFQSRSYIKQPKSIKMKYLQKIKTI